MPHSPPCLDGSFDVAAAGGLLAHMLEAWLVGEASVARAEEAKDDRQDYRAAPPEAGLRVCAPVHRHAPTHLGGVGAFGQEPRGIQVGTGFLQ